MKVGAGGSSIDVVVGKWFNVWRWRVSVVLMVYVGVEFDGVRY